MKTCWLFTANKTWSMLTWCHITSKHQPVSSLHLDSYRLTSFSHDASLLSPSLRTVRTAGITSASWFCSLWPCRKHSNTSTLTRETASRSESVRSDSLHSCIIFIIWHFVFIKLKTFTIDFPTTTSWHHLQVSLTARWSQAWSAPPNLSTTSGVWRWTWRAGWRAPESAGGSRWGRRAAGVFVGL